MKNNIEPKKSSFKLMIIGIVIIATLLFSFVFITNQKQLDATNNSDTVATATQEYVLDANYELNTDSIPVNTDVVINVDDMSGCNEKFFVTLPDGESIFVDTTEVDSFTINSSKPGTVTIECWMSMSSGSFEVQ